MPRSESKPSKKKQTTRSRRVTPRGRVLNRRGISFRIIPPGKVPNWSRILLFSGVLLLSYWSIHKYFYYRSLTLSRAQTAQIVREQPKAVILPSHIFIPWNTDSDIEAFSFVNGEWQTSDTKVTYLLGSARPGEAGNIILYGHNRKEILGNIRALKGGEPITLTTSDGIKREYRVSSVKETTPQDISMLAPTRSEALTMYTCSGLLDSQRFIVRALPVK